MTEQLSNITAVSVSDTNASFSFVGGTFTLGPGPFADLSFSAQDDETDFASFSPQPSETQGPGRQTGQLFNAATGNTVSGVASLQQVLTLTDPATGNTVQVGRVRLTEDNNSFGNGALLGDVFIFDGPIDPNIVYNVTTINFSPGDGEANGVPYATFADSSLGGGAVCFEEGTFIRMEQGECPIELIKPGDRIQTVDGGVKEVLWHGHRFINEAAMRRNNSLKPVLIATGAIGNSRPLTVSQQHRITVGGKFVKAKDLPTIQGMRARIGYGRKQISYHHLLLEDHQVLLANGAEAESLYLGPVAQGWLKAGVYGTAGNDSFKYANASHAHICRPVIPRRHLAGMDMH
ncbi:MAG: Hint domain-containing protein [Sulfitobacter sp.]